LLRAGGRNCEGVEEVEEVEEVEWFEDQLLRNCEKKRHKEEHRTSEK
jgi:hypothetical protein